MINKNGKIDIFCYDVDSSTVESIHFHFNKDKGYLGVTFKSGISYVYANVRLDSIIRVITHESYGEGFNKYIKGSYAYKQIGDCNGQSPLIKAGLVEDGIK